LSRALEIICRDNLGLSPGESLLIVADPPLERLAARMAEFAREVGLSCELLEVGRVERAGLAPRGFTTETLAKAEAVLLVTSKSLSHTEQRRKACTDYGVRIASMPGVTEDMLCRLFRPGALRLVQQRTLAMAARLEGVKRVRLRTERGTELELSLEGRKIYTDTGVYHRPGSFGNLPAGEVSASPVPRTLSGRLVVDVAFAGLGKVDGLVLEIEKGGLVSARGEKSREVMKLLSGAAERLAGEFGIGTNPLARACPPTLEAEKALGTVHFGFGDNRSFGGENAASGHWDAVAHCERIEVDGELLELSAE